MSEANEVPVDKLTKAYLKIKAKRAEIAAAYKLEEDALSKQQDQIKKALLEYCKTQNLDSVRTAAGLFYRSIKTRYWTSDWDSMNQFIMQHEIPEFFEKRLNQTVVKQFLEENPDLLPPGLNVDSEYTLTIRK
jgi:hypothetical protein